VCVYCGSRFLTRQPRPAPLPVATPVAAPPRKSGNAGVVVALVGGLAILMALGGAAALWSNSQPPTAAPVTPPNPNATQTLEVAAPPPEAPASATFSADSRIPGYQTSFYVLGFVKNTSPFIIDKPKVTAVLLDKSGKEVATRDGYAEADNVAPDTTVPIKVLISEPPAHDRIRFEVVVTKASYVPAQVDGLRLEMLGQPHATFGSSWEVAGKVHNDGKQPARFVKILVLGFDPQNKLCGIDTTYADGQTLAPGSAARFRAMPLYDTAPHHFQFSVSGQVAK
jgi:hypothetical protein